MQFTLGIFIKSKLQHSTQNFSHSHNKPVFIPQPIVIAVIYIKTKNESCIVLDNPESTNLCLICSIEWLERATDGILSREDCREAGRVDVAVREELDPEARSRSVDVARSSGATEHAKLRRIRTVTIPDLHIVPAGSVTAVLTQLYGKNLVSS